MFVHPDIQTNQDLIEALYSTVREQSDVLVFDWDRNGLFNHEYSDLSNAVVSAELDRASLQTDLPESVNIVQGFSSAELSITLSGKRYSDEPSLASTLSPFNPEGPFFNDDLTGTPVRYSKQVFLANGEAVSIRQFTGVIRDVQFNIRNDTIDLLCTDIAPWSNNVMTLPHWAVDRFIRYEEEIGATRPINAAWVFNECMRQAGTDIGPPERDDCVFSASLVGSALPSIGTPQQLDVMYSDAHKLPVPDETALWESGKFAPAMRRLDPGHSSSDIMTNRFESSGPILVPAGANQFDGPFPMDDRIFGQAVWFESMGGPAEAVPGESDDYWKKEGFLAAIGWDSNTGLLNGYFQVLNTGQICVTLFSDLFDSYSIYQWTYPPQPAGWRYFAAEIRLSNDSMTVKAWCDDVELVPSTSATAPAFIYYTTPANFDDPRRYLFDRFHGFIGSFGRAQYYQCYTAEDTTGTTWLYEPGQGNPPLTLDGKPHAIFAGCIAEMSYIPEVWNEPIWNVLQNLANGEFAAMLTNEYGQIYWKTHPSLRQETPTLASAEYTVDNLLDLALNPSLDQYKNSLVLGYTNGAQDAVDLWSPDNGSQFPTPDDGVWRISDWIRVDGMVMPDTTPELREGNSDFINTVYNRTYFSQVSGTWLNDSTRDMVNEGYSFWTELEISDDQRSFRVYSWVPPQANITGAYVGGQMTDNPSDIPGPRFIVRAKAYTGSTEHYYALDDAEEIAEHGRFSLILEPTEWRQTLATVFTLAPWLLEDVTVPVPVINNLKIPTDPRIQITDVIGLRATGPLDAYVIAQVVGIRRSAPESVDYLDVRILKTPSRWVLGTPSASELGLTTILN